MFGALTERALRDGSLLITPTYAAGGHRRLTRLPTAAPAGAASALRS